MTTVKHTAVVLHLPKPVPEVLAYSKQIVQAMTGNAYFPAPTPALLAVTASIAALDAAETTAKTKVMGAAEARDLKLTAVINNLHGLKGYVQLIADANPVQANAIIESAAMAVRQSSAHDKAELEATMGSSAGTVILRAKAADKHAAYEWQYSSDGGKTWIVLPVTTVADTSVSGLTLGETYLFKVRATVGRVTGDWSQIISFLVH